jgi:hypothetical protein
VGGFNLGVIFLCFVINGAM